MGYAQQAVLATNAAILDQVRVSAVTAAIQILGEEQGERSDAAFAKRQALAEQVMGGVEPLVPRFAWAVVANPSISEGASDGDVQFTINAVWDDVAGVRSTD